MIRNYLLVAVRNILHNPGYTLINVVGLAIGLACCVLISLYIMDELSYDQFHDKGGRIYRLVRVQQLDGGSVSYDLGTSGAAGPALVQDFPEVEASVRYISWGGTWTRHGEKAFNTRFCVTDQAFLDVFDFPLVRGDRATALTEHGSVLITETEAARFFGTEDPVGKTVEVDDRYLGGLYTITGVMADPPDHSTLEFGFVTSTFTNTSWIRDVFENWVIESSFHPALNFFLLRPGTDPVRFEQKVQQLILTYMGEEAAKTNEYRIMNFPRTYLHARSEFDVEWFGDITYVYLFASAGLFILLIAAINFMNLATARSAGRAREVGLRKTSGAYRSQLIGQFLSESVLTSLVSGAIAVLLIIIFLPEMNAFAGKEISLSDNWETVGTLLIGLAVSVGLLAGLYPALFLSAFDPVKVLKGTLAAGAGNASVRKVLVVFQFGISAFLIVGTATVFLQMRHVQSMNLGFDRDLMLVTGIFSTDRRLTDRYNAVKNEYLKHPNILKASGSHSTMGYGGQLDQVYPEGHETTDWRMRVIGVDEAFLDTYGIELVAGRDFDPLAFSTDTTQAFILNETAVRQLGWAENDDVSSAIGKSFGWAARGHEEGRVIGVVKDFNNRSLREEIRPVVISMWIPKLNNLSLKIRGDQIEETRAYVDEVWKKFIPDKSPWSEFLDERLNEMYEQEQRTGDMSVICAGLAVFIACLGLVGLASYTSEQRTREVGIRKAIGASESGIVVLMTQEFVLLVAVANAIALPVSYYVMRDWLSAFAYRIPLDISIFGMAFGLSMVIALGTVSYHAVRAMRLDPVTALRQE